MLKMELPSCPDHVTADHLISLFNRGGKLPFFLPLKARGGDPAGDKIPAFREKYRQRALDAVVDGGEKARPELD